MVSRDPASPSDDLTRRIPAADPAMPRTSQTSSTYQSPSTSDDSTSVAEKAGEVAGAARERASHAMHSAEKSVDAQRDTVAGSLDTVASQLRERAEMIPGGDKTTDAAQSAARGIETASDYLREHDVEDMKSDLERFVRSHPTESLVVALAAGFLVGRMFKS